MAELKEGQRVNAQGEVVEFNENSGRWESVKEEREDTKTEQTVETSNPAPEGETVVREGESTPRRARATAEGDK